MANLTGWAAAWDTCLTKLKTSIAERQASPAGGLERTFCARTSSRVAIWNLRVDEREPGSHRRARSRGASVGAIGLRQIAASSNVRLLWDYTQRC